MKNILAAVILIFSVLTVSASDKTNKQVVSLSVTEKGFEPDQINVKPGTHVILKVTRKTNATCAMQIKISEKKIKKDLPLNQEVSVDVGILQKGKITFACGMDMITGYINIK